MGILRGNRQVMLIIVAYKRSTRKRESHQFSIVCVKIVLRQHQVISVISTMKLFIVVILAVFVASALAYPASEVEEAVDGIEASPRIQRSAAPNPDPHHHRGGGGYYGGGGRGGGGYYPGGGYYQGGGGYHRGGGGYYGGGHGYYGGGGGGYYRRTGGIGLIIL